MTGLTEFNFADVWEAVVDRVGDREALVFLDRRFTYAELEARANRLAHYMAAQGVGAGDHVGLYLMNCPEYVEALLAAYKLRAVPINVNYRYVQDELRYLLDDADVVGVLYNDQLAERIRGVRDGLPDVSWWLDVDTEYEDIIVGFSPDRDFGPRSGDDAYVLYTGGTTGMPKGVVWRQEDAFFSCIGGGDPTRLIGPVDKPAEVLDRIIDDPFVYFPVAPLMHAAGQWTSLSWWYAGGTVVLLPGSLDPAFVWRTIEDEKVNLVTVVGDPVVRPLVDEWERSGPYDVSSLFSIGSGGAPLSPVLRNRLAELLPNITVSDGFGSSETGAQGSYRTAGASGDGHARFVPMDDTTVVLDETTLQQVEPGSGAVGRVARSGHIPTGYYNDPEKTARDLRRGERAPLRHHRRHGHRRGRRHHPIARSRVGLHQHRRREGLPRRGRKRAEGPPQCVRRARGRGTRRALGATGGRGGAAGRGHESHARRARRALPRTASPATRCRARSCWSIRSCARPRARPTIAGPSPSPNHRPTDRTGR